MKIQCKWLRARTTLRWKDTGRTTLKASQMEEGVEETVQTDHFAQGDGGKMS